MRALGVAELIQQVAESLVDGTIICPREAGQLFGVDAFGEIGNDRRDSVDAAGGVR